MDSKANDPHFAVPDDADLSQIVVWDATMPEFTREDVATIRANCEGFRYVARQIGGTEAMEREIAKLLSIADRIEALLPPEA